MKSQRKNQPKRVGFWGGERLKSKLALSIRPAQIGSRMMNWFGREKMSSALKKLS